MRSMFICVAFVVLSLLAGCSGSETATSDSTLRSTSDACTVSGRLWDPCGLLDLEDITVRFDEVGSLVYWDAVSDSDGIFSNSNLDTWEVYEIEWANGEPFNGYNYSEPMGTTQPCPDAPYWMLPRIAITKDADYSISGTVFRGPGVTYDDVMNVTLTLHYYHDSQAQTQGQAVTSPDRLCYYRFSDLDETCWEMMASAPSGFKISKWGTWTEPIHTDDDITQIFWLMEVDN